MGLRIFITLLFFTLPVFAEESRILESKVEVHFEPEKAAVIYEKSLGEFVVQQASIKPINESYLAASQIEEEKESLRYSFFMQKGESSLAGTEVSQKELVVVTKGDEKLDDYEKELEELESSLELQRENLFKLEQNIEIINERIAKMTGTKSVVELEEAVQKKEVYRERKKAEIKRLKALVDEGAEVIDEDGAGAKLMELQNQLKEASIITASAYLSRSQQSKRAAKKLVPKKVNVFQIRQMEEDLRRLQKKRLVLEGAL